MPLVRSKKTKPELKSTLASDNKGKVLHGLGTKSKSSDRSGPRPKPAVAPAKTNLAVELRERLQLNQSHFARLLAVSVRSLASLESGKKPTEAVARRLNEVHRLTDALSEVVNNDAIGTWLQTQAPAFDGLKPLEVIDRGEIDRIWSMIYFLRSGVAS